MIYQLNFDLNAFLEEFWQKKPVLIKKGFVDFKDPLTSNELAGLAMEDDVDSRLITNKNNEWRVTHGPFKQFDDFPENYAQLVVQAANHWHGEVQALAEAFDQLPRWLFEDVMACFSQCMGGVGPHIDQYDVFIIQGTGRRCWRVGNTGSYTETNLHTGLRQIERFEAILDEEVTAGDILYIPAGFPHAGESLEASLSYSIGFRSPSSQELLSNFADYAIAQDMGGSRYINTTLQARTDPSAIYQDEYECLMALLTSLFTNNKSKKKWLGEYLSQSRHELDIIESDRPWQQSDIAQLLEEGASLYKVAGLRTLYYPEEPRQLYINGEAFFLSSDDEKFAARKLCNYQVINGSNLGGITQDSDFLAVLTQWVNQGYWYFKGY